MTDKELNSTLQAKLKDIADVLYDSTEKFNNPGILDGVSGLALFMFYYSRFTGDPKYSEVGEKALEKAIDLINDGYTFHTFCSGISGLVWTCEHLVQNSFIDDESVSFIEEFEPYLLSCMEKDFGTGNYDFLHGGLGVGYYFLKKRIPSTMNNKVWYLWLKNKAITCTDGCFKWESTLSDSRKKGFNISLSHGMSSIVVCLTKLMEKYPHVVTIKDILSNTIRYILQQRFINPVISHFPSYSIESEENPNPSRLGWCYGDLGIAQSLLQASRALENEEYKKIALNILLDSCKRKSLQENNVMDAGICHGTSGISHIYNRLSKDLNYNIFKEMSIYWMEKTIENDRFKDGLAGYKTWIGKNEWKEQYCLLDGISGIGLSIMAHLKSDFMDWDECLLLN